MTDIVRTVHVKKPVTGAQIVDALKQIAEDVNSEYAQMPLKDTDGVQTLTVGLSNPYPYAEVSIRTGKGLAGVGVQLSKKYSVFGVGNAVWSGDKYAIRYDDSHVVNAVEEVRDGLERLL